jgi:hypothetical protein
VGTLLVAAGGGGDAIAAGALATLAPGGGVGIVTMAWDRLLIDPLPGPRTAAEFTGLEWHDGWWMVTASSRPIAPAGSALPRLAADIPMPLVLLDPAGGARSMRRQIEAAATDLGAGDIRLVDVGGDVLGRPGDVGLRSPFADALTAASCTGLPCLTWIAGPGLDGELAESLVLHRAGDAAVFQLKPELWMPYLPILQWHPSEATALLASASLGIRGVVEIREAGLPVHLTGESPTMLELDMDAVGRVNPLVSVLSDTDSLGDAERRAVRLLGGTELDAERAKATRLKERRPSPVADAATALTGWEAEARKRGVDYVTYRRLAEALGLADVRSLRDTVTARHPERDTGLLWAVGQR